MKKSAALILALLIVTIAAIAVMASGRAVVSSSFTTNRFADSLIADSLAWAGVEKGLELLKGGDLNPDLTIRLLSKHLPGDYMPLSSDGDEYDYVVRYNLDKNNNSDTNEGIVYQTYLLNSGPGTGNWRQSDQYIDLRLSDSDFYPGKNKLNAVNLDSNDKIIYERGYYQVSNNDQAKFGDYVYRVFDMRDPSQDNLYGIYKTFTGVERLGDEYNEEQKFLFFWNAGSPLANSVEVTIGVHYIIPPNQDYDDPPDGPDEGMSCFANLPCSDLNHECPGNRKTSYSNDFWLTTANLAAGSRLGKFFVYIPWSCYYKKNDDFDNSHFIDYMVVRFKFTNASDDKLAFGLRLASSADEPGATSHWAPYDDSYLPTGVTKIKSTGIYGNIQKYLEVWAAKAVYADLTSTSGLKCINNNSSDLKTCKIIIYRDTRLEEHR